MKKYAIDRNDLVPAQEKLEWVTPKISLIGAGDTEGKFFPWSKECPSSTCNPTQIANLGPS